jgi:hypothetical protein
MRKLWAFLADNELVTIAVAFLVNGATVAVATPIRLVVLAVTFVFLALVAFSVREVVSWRRRQGQIGLVAGAAAHRGLILTLSPTSHEPLSAADLALRAVRPEYLGLLGTKQTEAAQVDERLLAERCPAAGLLLRDAIAKRCDPGQLRDAARTVETLIDWMNDQGLAPDDLVVDVTGGTATMSIAAFLAAQARGVLCQYIESDFDATGTRVAGSERFVLVGAGAQAAGQAARHQVVPSRHGAGTDT